LIEGEVKTHEITILLVKNKCCIFEICALNLNTLSKFNFSKATDLAQALKQQLILWMAPSRLPRQSDC